jgi:hypothetical protein
MVVAALTGQTHHPFQTTIGVTSNLHLLLARQVEIRRQNHHQQKRPEPQMQKKRVD